VKTKSFSSTRADWHGEIALCCACATGLLSIFQNLSEKCGLTRIHLDVLELRFEKVKLLLNFQRPTKAILGCNDSRALCDVKRSHVANADHVARVRVRPD
jgi:hypothetical protein